MVGKDYCDDLEWIMSVGMNKFPFWKLRREADLEPPSLLSAMPGILVEETAAPDDAIYV